MNKILFVLLMVLSATVVLAEELTSAPGIYVEEGPILTVEPDFGVRDTLTEESVILELYVNPVNYNDGAYFLRLYLDGVEAEYPYTLPRDQEDYVVMATVQMNLEGLDIEYIRHRDITVPALETISPGNKYDVNGDGEVNIADVNEIIKFILGN